MPFHGHASQLPPDRERHALSSMSPSSSATVSRGGSESKLGYPSGEGKSSQPGSSFDENSNTHAFDRSRFAAGQLVDVKDDVGVWCEAEIMQVAPAEPGLASKQDEDSQHPATEDDENTPLCVYVHFIYWGKEFDEWIECTSDRLSPRGSHVFLGHNLPPNSPGSQLRVGQRVDALDIHPKHNFWATANIVDMSSDRVKLHWFNFHVKFDEWVSARSPRIKPYGRMQKISHPDWKRHSLRLAKMHKEAQFREMFGNSAGAEGKMDSYSASDYLSAQREASKVRRSSSNTQWAQQGSLDPRYAHYRHTLWKEGLLVIGAEGDGNCLFRAVSRQMYGNEEHHAMIRAACMDYMLINRDYFENFVEGGREGFSAYVNNKRRNAVWGDDLEIQAMGELYVRPVHVYQYHPLQGACMLRRVQTAQLSNVEPMRLSFFGGGHYDSIERDDHRTRVLNERPGVFENRALERARLTVSAQVRLDAAAVRGPEDSTHMEAALHASRQAWCDMGVEQMELAYERSLQSMTEEQMIDMAKKASVEMAQSGTSGSLQGDLEAAIAESIKNAPHASEEALLQEALRMSQSSAQSSAERDQIRRAMELSLVQSGSDNFSNQDAEAIQASIMEASRRQHEEEELKRTLDISRKMADDETFQIQQAMAASMSQSSAVAFSDQGDVELQLALAESMRK